MTLRTGIQEREILPYKVSKIDAEKLIISNCYL
jgi:hypothetical protein